MGSASRLHQCLLKHFECPRKEDAVKCLVILIMQMFVAKGILTFF